MRPGPYLIWGLLAAGAIVVSGVILGQGESVTYEEIADGSAFRTTAILSGKVQNNMSENFAGGRATAFMGGVQLDLTNATMEGDQAVIDIFAMMGGVEMRIPRDWEVVDNVTALMGGVEDKTRLERTGQSKRLILQGSAIMGGVSIRN